MSIKFEQNIIFKPFGLNIIVRVVYYTQLELLFDNITLFIITTILIICFFIIVNIKSLHFK